MTQPTSRSIIKAIACSKPTISEHLRKWKHNGTIVDQCKQRGALCNIGLAKDSGGHLVNQTRLSFFDKRWETTVGHQISIMKRKTKKTNERRTWWRKCTGETACLCTQMSGSNLSEGFWCESVATFPAPPFYSFCEPRRYRCEAISETVWEKTLTTEQETDRRKKQLCSSAAVYILGKLKLSLSFLSTQKLPVVTWSVT